nr:hypothetical protein [Deltaproteobacteria bacterium]
PDMVWRSSAATSDDIYESYQTEDNEAKRDDDNFRHVAAWEFAGDDREPVFHKEPLIFENVELAQRSYK